MHLETLPTIMSLKCQECSTVHLNAFHFLFCNCAEYSDIVYRQYAKNNKHHTVGHHKILLARAALLKRMNSNVKYTNANSGLKPTVLDFLSYSTKKSEEKKDISL